MPVATTALVTSSDAMSSASSAKYSRRHCFRVERTNIREQPAAVATAARLIELVMLGRGLVMTGSGGVTSFIRRVGGCSAASIIGGAAFRIRTWSVPCSVSDRCRAVEKAVSESQLLISADATHQEAHGVAARSGRDGSELDENQLVARVHYWSSSFVGSLVIRTEPYIRGQTTTWESSTTHLRWGWMARLATGVGPVASPAGLGASESEVVFSENGRCAREVAATRRTPTVVTVVFVEDFHGPCNELVNLRAQAGWDRFDHSAHPRRGSEEGQQPVAYERRGLLGRLAVHVDSHHVEARLHQPIDGLLVEVSLGVAAAGRKLETIVRPALNESFRDDFGVGFEDHSQVGPIGLGIELPEERRVNTIEALHDEARRDVTVAQHDAAGLDIRSDFDLKVVVAISCVQTGQRVTLGRLGQLATQRADGARRRLGGYVYVFASGGQELCEVLDDRGFARAAWPVHTHEQATLMVRKGS